MDETNNVEFTRNVGLVRYRHSLQHIYQHPYITEDTLRLRKQAKQIVDTLQHDTGRHMIGFLHGSTGMGIARAQSDIDGIILHSGKNTEEIKNEISKLVNNAETKNLAMFFEKDIFFPEGIDPDSFTACIFLPAIGEFEDPTIQKEADELRALALRRIVENATKKNLPIEPMWEKIKGWIQNEFIPNESDDEDKEEYFNHRINRWFEAILKQQHRTGPVPYDEREKLREELMGITNSLRSQLNFPDIHTMLSAYNIPDTTIR